MKTRRDAPRLALTLLTAILTVGFIDRIVMNVLAVPVQAEFRITDTQVGLLTGFAFAILNVTLGIGVARYAERGHRMRLIVVGTLLWSLATAACGFVANFTQLLLARVGVGVGEAVGLPANQSVIGDYFPAEKRATAMSVLMLSPPIGAFLGAAGGGWIGQEFGWRNAFLIATVPGALLAVAAWALIADPPRGRYDREASGEVPSLWAVFGRLMGLRSARHLVAGSTIASLVGFGLNGFFTFLLVRKFGMSLAQAAFWSALLGSLPGAIAVIAGGRLADAHGPKRPSLYAAIPGWCLIVAAPLYIFGITRGSAPLLLAVVFVAALFQYNLPRRHVRRVPEPAALTHAGDRLGGAQRDLYAGRPGPWRAAGRLPERPPRAALRQRRRPCLCDGDHRRDLPVGGRALPHRGAPCRGRPGAGARGRGMNVSARGDRG